MHWETAPKNKSVPPIIPSPSTQQHISCLVTITLVHRSLSEQGCNISQVNFVRSDTSFDMIVTTLTSTERILKSPRIPTWNTVFSRLYSVIFPPTSHCWNSSFCSGGIDYKYTNRRFRAETAAIHRAPGTPCTGVIGRLSPLVSGMQVGGGDGPGLLEKVVGIWLWSYKWILQPTVKLSTYPVETKELNEWPLQRNRQ